MLLSKSDFKIASECCKKLIYKKSNFLTKNDESEYAEMLAQGGHIVAKYAQIMYPEGIEIKDNSLDDSIQETKKKIEENENITLFEATIKSGCKVIRIDILEKKKNTFNLIEVKSKSYDTDEEDISKAKKKLEENIEDVTYQTLVLKESYPGYEINPYLLLPDKSKRSAIEGLAGYFLVNKNKEEKFEIEELPYKSTVGFTKPLVEFKYENDKNKKDYIKEIQAGSLLTLVPVEEEVNKNVEEIRNRTDKSINILKNGIKAEDYLINKNCKDCEFNLGKEKEKNGFRECWKELADIEPKIFDLYFGGAIGHYTKGWYFDELISTRKVSFWDIDIERFKDSKGKLGNRGQRQLLQYNNTKSDTEYFGEGLKSELKQLKYPLHFIDFETYLGAIPFHKGMRPYELVAFQWSCHTINDAESEPIHSEWINLNYDFPNFRFAEALMDKIGDSGTPLMWSNYENTILRNVLKQMDIFGYTNENLKNWLTGITKDKKEGRQGRFIDLNDLTLQYYFHPEMKGKTSIKKVLPAVWNNNPYLHSIPWFKKYKPDSLESLNPYDTLSPIINELENEEVVKDGTGAMRAYHELMFGEQSQNVEKREQIKKLLLQYCELDTMAMVIIWKYWMDKVG